MTNKTSKVGKLKIEIGTVFDIKSDQGTFPIELVQVRKPKQGSTTVVSFRVTNEEDFDKFAALLENQTTPLRLRKRPTITH